MQRSAGSNPPWNPCWLGQLRWPTFSSWCFCSFARSYTPSTQSSEWRRSHLLSRCSRDEDWINKCVHLRFASLIPPYPQIKSRQTAKFSLPAPTYPPTTDFRHLLRQNEQTQFHFSPLRRLRSFYRCWRQGLLSYWQVVAHRQFPSWQ